ncbi:MAG TPA: hypothetical protein VE152_06470, partial [Acidimicrobiales bacterium]|nr:hypothetical protein [Acidimicrobiales bacterium]
HQGEVVSDPGLLDHGLLAVAEADQEGPPGVVPGRWLEIPGERAPAPGPAPDLGAHSAEVLLEAGIPPGRVRDLAVAGTVVDTGGDSTGPVPGIGRPGEA